MAWVRGLAVTATLAALAGGGWWWLNARPVEVVVAAPVRAEAAEVVYATGIVEPRKWAKVTTVIRERIVDLCRCEGDEIAAGQVLGRLDDGDQRAALRELEARELFATSELERTVDLLKRNVVSQQAYERAKTEVAQVQATLAAARAKLDDYVLRSPLEGTVLRSDGAVGEVAEPGQVLFWVGQPRPLEIVADINEEDIPRVLVGQRALLGADAFPSQRFQAGVQSITPKGDPVAKTYRVRLKVPDDAPLRIGMTVEVNIVVRTVADALLIPRPAVDAGRVAVAEAGRLRFQPVRVGIRGAERVEVLDGIGQDARVVVPFPVKLPEGRAIVAAPSP